MPTGAALGQSIRCDQLCRVMGDNRNSRPTTIRIPDSATIAELWVEFLATSKLGYRQTGEEVVCLGESGREFGLCFIGPLIQGFA